MGEENGNKILGIPGMVVAGRVTKEEEKGDKRVLTMKLGDEIEVRLTAPLKGTEVFRKDMMVDVVFTTPQQTLPSE